jgi:hypothetical protein
MTSQQRFLVACLGQAVIYAVGMWIVLALQLKPGDVWHLTSYRTVVYAVTLFGVGEGSWRLRRWVTNEEPRRAVTWRTMGLVLAGAAGLAWAFFAR